MGMTILEQMIRDNWSRWEPLDPSSAPSSAFKPIDKSAVSGNNFNSRRLLMDPKVLYLLAPHPKFICVHNAYDGSSHLQIAPHPKSLDLHHALTFAGPLRELNAARSSNQCEWPQRTCSLRLYATKDFEKEVKKESEHGI
ncbi:uncharacterized protein LOC120288709 [Eucalyptus grandis]|uniref:uncharacterized protein LOC120288709 n=1 Tax=Eucalyptus grandis TaxID=71139 RepID=UPI00192EF1EE|nr:uncharacterized protein LOC120288709 [Eucalyptus grandis]